MAVNSNWPLNVTSICFNADPFDQAATPTYVPIGGVAGSDSGDRVQSLDSAGGRQYELDTNQAGTAALTLYDKDEVFNPTNPNGTYYPNVKVYRRIIDQAMWPPAPIGSAVNLLNVTSGYDPSFEATAVGNQPANLLTAGGIAPSVVAANPFVGINSLQWSVLGNSTEQVGGFKLTCIPGQQYTFSVYVRQTGANTTVVFINGGAGGTSTTTTGSYVRLSVTFTATRPDHQVFVGSFTPTIASTVNIDAIQMEPGASASTFSLTGPVIYGVFAGHVERWPSNWNYNGTYGMAQITAVDAFGPMANQDFFTEYRNSVLVKSPDYYWALNEPQDSASFAETSGNGGPPLGIWVSQVGLGSGALTAGEQVPIPGDPSGVGVKFVAPAATIAGDDPGSILGTGPVFAATQINFPSTANGSSYGMTISAWIHLTYPFPVNSSKFVVKVATFFPNNGTQIAPGSIVANFDGSLDMTFFGPGGTFANVPAGPANAVNDGKPHLVICTLSQTSGGGNTTLTIYLDGNPYSTPTILPTSSLGLISTPELNIMVGGRNDGVDTTQIVNGTVSHVAMWSRVLTAFEIADLWNAGGTGYLGERSDQRVSRYLGYHYIAPSSLEVGASIMGISDLTGDGSLLDGCQKVTTSENGNLFIDGNGTITFQSRTHRYLETVASWVFGENPAGGSITDVFARTVSNGWGNASSGQAWTTSGGSSSDYAVGSGVGTQSNGTVNVLRTAIANYGSSDFDFTVDFSLPITNAATAPVTTWVCGRLTDLSNYYIARMDLSTAGQMSILIAKRVAGSLTTIVPNVTVGPNTSGLVWRVRFRGLGTLLTAKAWNPANESEPMAWTIATQDSSLTTGNNVGILSRLETGNTNTLPIVFTVDNVSTTPGSEIPYLGDIAFDFDPTQIYNDVQVTNAGGVTAVNTGSTAVTASLKSYGKKSYQRNVNVSDLEAQDAANWIVSGHLDPHQRIQSITIDPASNPALWPAALGIKIGDRVTVNRRTNAFTMSADYFVERIEHSRAPGQWHVTYQLSPFAITRQPWLLEDSTWGILEQTTVLGY